jgi:hypothetical protein
MLRRRASVVRMDSSNTLIADLADEGGLSRIRQQKKRLLLFSSASFASSAVQPSKAAAREAGTRSLRSG